MPNYLLAIAGNDDAYAALGEDEARAMYAGHDRFIAALAEAGVPLVSGAELASPNSARTVHPDGSVTDGPFAETKEQLGGLYVIDVPDLDTAVSWARKIPMLPTDKIEVRPTR